MRAACRDVYGPPEVVAIREISRPLPRDDEILIRVRAVSLNASDWESLTGAPAYVRAWGVFRPRLRVLGSDVAGEVVEVGRRVTKFQRGDEVFGDIMANYGGLAEYACGRESVFVKKPRELSFEQAAALPQAGVVAFQGLAQGCRLRAGEHILVNGAGGGAGTYAVQLAKLWGAEVTAVDRPDKLEFLRQLGADHVLDYEAVDFADGSRKYDAILDVVARRSPLEVRRALAVGGRYALVGGSMKALLQMVTLGSLLSVFTGKRTLVVAVQPTTADVEHLLELISEGSLRPIIDKTFPLDDARDALRYLGAANARGKVVVTP